ncbi:peroxisomal sarcosine oxidase-like [Argonauta hians]
MSNGMYDAIVVGAGINGSSTAHYLQKHGQNTLLLEQFPLPHTRGSSHGQSRTIRKAYTQEIFASMMREAYPMWEQLERDSGTKFFKKHKLLAMSLNHNTYVDQVKNTLSTLNMDYEMVDPEQLMLNYQIRLPPGSKGILDPEGGILHADRALKAYQDQFVKLGGHLVDGCRLLSVMPGHVVKVTTSKGEFSCRKLILCLGGWAKSYFHQQHIDFPLKVQRITVGYYKKKFSTETHSGAELPVLFYASGQDEFYGLPAAEYPGLIKFCCHAGPEIDPEHRDGVNCDWIVEKCRRVIEESFPMLHSQPSILESCIYTMTPDEHFVLDHHPQHKNIILAAGFSGHGFKLAPVTGKILAEMALNKEPSYDMSHFRLDRFTRKSRL